MSGSVSYKYWNSTCGIEEVLDAFLGFYRPDLDEIFTACGGRSSKTICTPFHARVTQVLDTLVRIKP